MKQKLNRTRTFKLSPFSAASFLASGLAYTRDEDEDDEGNEIGAVATAGEGAAGAGARAATGAAAGAGAGLAAACAGALSSLNSLNAATSLSFSTIIHTS